MPRRPYPDNLDQPFVYRKERWSRAQREQADKWVREKKHLHGEPLSEPEAKADLTLNANKGVAKSCREYAADWGWRPEQVMEFLRGLPGEVKVTGTGVLPLFGG